MESLLASDIPQDEYPMELWFFRYTIDDELPEIWSVYLSMVQSKDDDDSLNTDDFELSERLLLPHTTIKLLPPLAM